MGRQVTPIHNRCESLSDSVGLLWSRSSVFCKAEGPLGGWDSSAHVIVLRGEELRFFSFKFCSLLIISFGDYSLSFGREGVIIIREDN